MVNYQNFGLALYFTARCIQSIDNMETFEKQFAFFEKHLKLSKVYLETYRDEIETPREKLKELKVFFIKKNIRVSGAITTTQMHLVKNKKMIKQPGEFGSGGTVLNQKIKAKEGYVRRSAPICYTNTEMAERLKAVCEFTASIFDEFILDDFYFFNCTCPDCISEKGERSWEEFRLERMTEVSKKYVVGPAKAVNSKCNVIIKFPNWCEAYQQSGYNPETEPLIFDEVYTGTETRDSDDIHQNLPRYGSYSLMRWLENVKPGHNGGGWIDHLGSLSNLNYFTEQALLTLFAKGRELTLFCFSWLLNNAVVPPLGLQLEHLDQLIGKAGNPRGIPVYEPFHAHGEDHLYDILGSAGLVFEPSPEYVQSGMLEFITQNSAKDSDILKKIKQSLLDGRDVCVTTGFLKVMQGKGVEEFTSARMTDRKVICREMSIFGMGTVHSGKFSTKKPVLLPIVEFMNNTVTSVVSCKTNENLFPVLLESEYGGSNFYVLTIPDDSAQIYDFSAEALTVIRQYLMNDLGIYLDCGSKVSLFLYDNDTFIVQSFIPGFQKIKIHVTGSDLRLIDLDTGEEITPVMSKRYESVFEITIQTLLYRMFRIK
jgi:hypothetical protein